MGALLWAFSVFSEAGDTARAGAVLQALQSLYRQHGVWLYGDTWVSEIGEIPTNGRLDVGNMAMFLHAVALGAMDPMPAPSDVPLPTDNISGWFTSHIVTRPGFGEGELVYRAAYDLAKHVNETTPASEIGSHAETFFDAWTEEFPGAITPAESVPSVDEAKTIVATDIGTTFIAAQPPRASGLPSYAAPLIVGGLGLAAIAMIAIQRKS